MSLEIRSATADDADTILSFIRALAAFEREPNAVKTTVEQLREQLASNRAPFECLLAVEGDSPVGFALFFENYSTWRGTAGIYLEDLYVIPEKRGSGVGGQLMRRVAGLVEERGYSRLELAVLNWNQAAIEVYEHLGGTPQTEWTVYRFDDESLARLTASK